MKSKTSLLIVFCTLFIVLLYVSGCARKPTETAAPRHEPEKLAKITSTIQDVLDAIDNDLAIAANDLSSSGLSGPGAHEILLTLCKKYDYFVDCAAIDSSGIIISIEPETRYRIEGDNIGDQAHVKELHRTKKPVMSEAFKAIEGFYAIDFAWPIFARNGKLIGSVSMIVKPDHFISKIVKPELSWDAFNIWVLEKTGRILYSKHKNVIGINALEDDRYKRDYSLRLLIEEIAEKYSGTK
ncbi:MAG: hypothetical protein ABH871_02715, partial [Pseudomonadota bacterium]